MALHEATRDTKPLPARATQTATTPKVVAQPDYVEAARKAEDQVAARIASNPIYKIIIEGQGEKEQRFAAVEEWLLRGLDDGTANEDELDRRQAALTEINLHIQAMRRQLSASQAREITDKAQADFQRIVTQTSADVKQFEEELAPLGQLAELFTKYGADGNLIEKINLAKDQKAARDRRRTYWQTEHSISVSAAITKVNNLRREIAVDEAELTKKWFGKATIEARIANNKIALEDAQQELQNIEAQQFQDAIASTESSVEQVDEGILDLQNIGGEKFKQAVSTLRDHTEQTLAKISANFDEAVTGLRNTRESFTTMDRTCSDAIFALSVLEVGVQQAETKSRAIAEGLVANAASETETQLDKMERERRSTAILAYTSALSTFLKDVGLAVTSLRGSQAVIQNILRINQQALQSANTHKVTGIANTADAVTIIIGSILDVCNRAASRALADALSGMRAKAQEGTARIAEGTYEGLQQEVAQLQEIVESVQSLKETTKDITANSVDLLRRSFDLMNKMREESNALADATTEAQRTTFNARAGIVQQKAEDVPPQSSGFSGFRISR